MLGPVELWHEGQPLRLAAAKQRALLALLLLDPNQPTSRDQLVDELWEESPPTSATATLHSFVYRLRKLLSDTGSAVTLHTRPSGYLLEVPPDAVDAWRFERLADQARATVTAGDTERAVGQLRDALALWRGEAFADIDLPSVRERARRLGQLRLDVTERMLAAELSLGRYGAVIGELEALTAAHPFRDRPWELLMTALSESGRRAEALEAYQRVYRVLATELGTEPSRALRDLQKRILRVQDATPQRASNAPAIPRQLPAGIGDFTGRSDSLDRLDDLLADSDSTTAVVISAIAGTAGIGKTTLAVHWAHRVTDRFPDGQLYVNLRGFDPAGPPIDPAEAVRGFLEALGEPPDRVPADLEARTARYRTLLADRRMLVVLDNARDSDQVRPLLPGGTNCLTLVTSRNQLGALVTVQGARLLTLDLLTADEARVLLARRVGEQRVAAEPKAVDEIVEHCARLPLALTIVAARVGPHPELPLHALAAELRLTHGPPDIRTVFSWSYDALGPEAARLFRLLGLHPGPDLSGAATASLAGLPVQAVRALLAELAAAHLITEHAPGRYTFHDLLRTYARELAHTEDTEAERDKAIRRLLEHYLHTAYALDRLLDPARDPISLDPPVTGVAPEEIADNDRAMAWFAKEHAVLLAVARSAASSGMDLLAWQLAWTLANFLDWQGHWHDWTATQQLAVEAAERLGDRTKQAHAYRVLAHVDGRLGRLEAAHTHLRCALERYAEIGDLAGQAQTHRTLGWVFSRQGEYAEALEQARTGLELFRAAGHLVGEATMCNAIGWYHTRLGNHEQALVHCQRALRLFEQLSDHEGAAATWDSLGHAHHHLGDYEQAIGCFRHALELWTGIGDRYYEAETAARLGDTQHAAGDVDAARQSWRQALDILEELDHPDATDVRAKLAQLP